MLVMATLLQVRDEAFDPCRDSQELVESEHGIRCWTVKGEKFCFEHHGRFDTVGTS